MIQSIQQKLRAGFVLKFALREAGFGLIEVMIAAVILAISLLAIASGEIQSFTMNEGSRERLRAVSAAEDILAMIRRNQDGLGDYGTFNTVNPAFAGPILTETQADFNRWKLAVAGIGGGTAIDTFDCGANKVRVACGVISVTPGLPPATLTSTVKVTISWPSLPGGFSLATTISPL